jgi:hypothetical protein
VPKRRSHGDGGIHWDASKERWIAAVYVGYTPAGKRRRVTASAHTKTEAKDKLKEKIREFEDGTALNSRGYTVAEAVSTWLTYGLHTRDPKTVDTLRTLANRHVIWCKEASGADR